MIALIESDKSLKARGGVYTGWERVCGVRVLRVVLRIDENTRSRRLGMLCSRARGEMESRGIKKVCFREDFTARDNFLQSGFSTISARPLMEKEAARISRLAAGGEQDTVAVFASRIMGAETETIRSLARDFRYVLLFSHVCPAAVVRDLSESYGAPLIECPSGEMLERAGAAVFFESPGTFVKLPEKCSAIFISGKAPENISYSRYVDSVSFYAPEILESSLPDGYPRVELLSAAAASGVRGTEDIRVSEIHVKYAENLLLQKIPALDKSRKNLYTL